MPGLEVWRVAELSHAFRVLTAPAYHTAPARAGREQLVRGGPWRDKLGMVRRGMGSPPALSLVSSHPASLLRPAGHHSEAQSWSSHPPAWWLLFTIRIKPGSVCGDVASWPGSCTLTPPLSMLWKIRAHCHFKYVPCSLMPFGLVLLPGWLLCKALLYPLCLGFDPHHLWPDNPLLWPGQVPPLCRMLLFHSNLSPILCCYPAPLHRHFVSFLCFSH